MKYSQGYIKRILLFSVILLLIAIYLFFKPFHKVEAPLVEIKKEAVQNGISVSVKHSVSTLKAGEREYKFDVEKPIVEGFENTNTERHINFQIADNLDDIHSEFKKELSEWNTPVEDDSSTLFVTATTSVVDKKVITVHFSVGSFMAGTAHPSSYEVTLNFDINTGKVLTLDDVLRDDYLTVLSRYSKDVLQERFIAEYDQYEEFFGKGSDPVPENYRSFLITNEGIIVVFDQYQVAAGVSGKQEVLVPWSYLSGVLKRT